MGNNIPPQYIEKPLHRFNSDGLEICYTVQSQFLQCNVQYSKIIVTSEEVALSKIPTAAICPNAIVPYPGAMFFF